MNVVEIKDLCKNPRYKEILRDVSLIIRERERVGFIGPNGAGKSTTKKCLTKLLKLDQGTTTIYRHNLGENREQTLENVFDMKRFIKNFMRRIYEFSY